MRRLLTQKRRRRCGLIGVPLSLRSGIVADLRYMYVIDVVRAQCGIETIESEACVRQVHHVNARSGKDVSELLVANKVSTIDSTDSMYSPAFASARAPLAPSIGALNIGPEASSRQVSGK